jgi:hypothetical protein
MTVTQTATGWAVVDGDRVLAEFPTHGGAGSIGTSGACSGAGGRQPTGAAASTTRARSRVT